MEVNNENTAKVTKKIKPDRSIKCPQCGSIMIINEENRCYKRAPPKLWARIFMNCSLSLKS